MKSNETTVSQRCSGILPGTHTIYAKGTPSTFESRGSNPTTASINLTCLEITIIHKTKGQIRPLSSLSHSLSSRYIPQSCCWYLEKEPPCSTSAAADACHFRLELQVRLLRPTVSHYLALALVRNQRLLRGRTRDTRHQRVMRVCPK